MGTSGKETTHLAELYITLRSTSGTAGIRKFSFIPTELTNSIRLASDNYKVEGKSEQQGILYSNTNSF